MKVLVVFFAFCSLIADDVPFDFLWHTPSKPAFVHSSDPTLHAILHEYFRMHLPKIEEALMPSFKLELLNNEYAIEDIILPDSSLKIDDELFKIVGQSLETMIEKQQRECQKEIEQIKKDLQQARYGMWTALFGSITALITTYALIYQKNIESPTFIEAP